MGDEFKTCQNVSVHVFVPEILILLDNHGFLILLDYHGVLILLGIPGSLILLRPLSRTKFDLNIDRGFGIVCVFPFSTGCRNSWTGKPNTPNVQGDFGRYSTDSSRFVCVRVDGFCSVNDRRRMITKYHHQVYESV